MPGVAGVKSLSNAMHGRHADVTQITPDVAGCYSCHPGPETQCLRDGHVAQGISCVQCHRDLARVGQNPNPWLTEPRCDQAGCHDTGQFNQNQALYRQSTGHGRNYCEACHDSTHAVAPSSEPDDGLKFVTLQGNNRFLSQCTVCQGLTPNQNEGPHQGEGEDQRGAPPARSVATGRCPGWNHRRVRRVPSARAVWSAAIAIAILPPLCWQRRLDRGRRRLRDPRSR